MPTTRYSLKTLLVVMTIAAVFFGFLGSTPPRKWPLVIGAFLCSAILFGLVVACMRADTYWLGLCSGVAMACMLYVDVVLLCALAFD